MSLGRLLTSGKSLIGLQNTECRYEMRTKNLLPKFGSDKNPFLKAKRESLQTESAPRVPVVARTVTPPDNATAKVEETKTLPAITALKEIQKPGTEPVMKKKFSSRIRQWLSKLNPLAWRRGKAKSGVSEKIPVQTELSLDRIKVLRNDLSDADVEVVPVKISLKPKAEPVVQPAAKAAQTAELIKT